MAGGVSPVVRGRRLAAALRRLRTASGKTVEEVAVHLECSAAKISRIENGLVGVRIQDARDLLDLYAVHGPQREELLDLVRQARGRGWWHPYADVMAEGFDRVIEFEAEASSIWMLESRIVPGLLQTEGYATALIASRRDVAPEVTERRIGLRMARRQILTRPEPASFHFVLDEALLRRRIGTPETMTEQYQRLARDARLPNVSLRVLPLAASVHQAVGFSFTVFGFVDPADPKAVFEELLEGTTLQESAEAAGRYTAAFDQAQACALSQADTLDFLAQLTDQYG